MSLDLKPRKIVMTVLSDNENYSRVHLESETPDSCIDYWLHANRGFGYVEAIVAPYSTGDRARAMFHFGQHGTCLASVIVEDVQPSARYGWWHVTYTLPNAERKTAHVDSGGRDIHGYFYKEEVDA